MKRGRQSTNIIDERPTSSAKGDRLLSSSATRDAANIVLRRAYAESGQISRAQKRNAEGLGLGPQLEDIQNQANKSQARLRRRMN